MVEGKLRPSIHPILRGSAGAIRYGYNIGNKDTDYFILTNGEDKQINDFEFHFDYFITSISTLKDLWGHPLLLGNITGECTGNENLCAFLRKFCKEITYTAPGKTANFGLEYIAVGERYGHTSPIKAGLRTAMILSHMAEVRDDPFLLSDEEKAVLIRARAGEVPPEERVEIYLRHLCPENLDKLRRMPENVTVKNELFALLDEICKEETP